MQSRADSSQLSWSHNIKTNIYKRLRLKNMVRKKHPKAAQKSIESVIIRLLQQDYSVGQTDLLLHNLQFNA